MGVSTDAILAFGFDIGESWEDSFETFFGEAFLGDDNEVDMHELDSELEAEGAPIELVQHCHVDNPMWVVAVRGTVTTAWRGYPKRIEGLTVDAEKVEAAKEYAQKRGWTWQEPQWLLVSNWS